MQNVMNKSQLLEVTYPKVNQPGQPVMMPMRPQNSKAPQESVAIGKPVNPNFYKYDPQNLYQSTMNHLEMSQSIEILIPDQKPISESQFEESQELDVLSTNWADEDTKKMIHNMVNRYIQPYLSRIIKTQSFGKLVQPRIILSTFTLWRDVCIDSCFGEPENNIYNMQVAMLEFTNLVDIELLNNSFRPLLLKHFKDLIQRETKYLPVDNIVYEKRAEENERKDRHLQETLKIEEIKTMPSYERLLDAVAKQYTIMELCEDLTRRLQSYGLLDYIDEEETFKQIQKGWELNGDNDKEKSYKEHVWGGVYATANKCLDGVNYILNQAQKATPYLLMADNSTLFVKGQACGTVISRTLTWIVDQRCDPKEVEERLDRCGRYFQDVANHLEKRYDEVTKQTIGAFKGNDTRLLSKKFCELMTGHSNVAEAGFKFRFKDFREEQIVEQQPSDLSESWIEIITDPKEYAHK